MHKKWDESVDARFTTLAVDLSSDVSWARLSFKSAAFILELGRISIQSGEVRCICSLAYLHAYQQVVQPQLKRETASTRLIFQSVTLPLIDCASH